MELVGIVEKRLLTRTTDFSTNGCYQKWRSLVSFPALHLAPPPLLLESYAFQTDKMADTLGLIQLE